MTPIGERDYHWMHHLSDTFGILPKILWPLLVSEFPLSTVKDLERRASGHLHRWLRLPRNLSLCSNSNKLKLPTNSLSEELMITQARDRQQYRESSDPKVSQAGIEVRTERK